MLRVSGGSPLKWPAPLHVTISVYVLFAQFAALQVYTSHPSICIQHGQEAVTTSKRIPPLSALDKTATPVTRGPSNYQGAFRRLARLGGDRFRDETTGLKCGNNVCKRNGSRRETTLECI